MIRILKIILVIMLPVSIFAEDGPIEKVGTTGALFLRIPVGAEAMAMGSAYTAIVANSNAAFWNPAALVQTTGKYDAQIHYTNWLVGLKHQAASVSMQFGGSYAIALSEIILSSPDMDVTTTRQQNGTGETFSYLDMALGLSLSKRFTDKFSLGGTLKFIGQSVYTVSTKGFAFDVGTFYKMGYKDYKLVMSMRNFGPDMQTGGTFFDTRRKGNTIVNEELEYDRYPLPLSISLGIAGTVYSGESINFLMSVDGYYPVEYSQRVNLGGKMTYNESLSLLFGYMINYEQESFSVGFGADFNEFNFEYAFRPMDVFNAVNTFSLGYQF